MVLAAGADRLAKDLLRLRRVIVAKTMWALLPVMLVGNAASIDPRPAQMSSRLGQDAGPVGRVSTNSIVRNFHRRQSAPAG